VTKNTVDGLLLDASFGVRILLRNRGFTAAAALTLALGIGGTSAIFSAVDAAVLRPPPFREPGRIVTLWNASSQQGVGHLPLTAGDFADFREQSGSFESAALCGLRSFNVAGEGEPERVIGARASHRLFPLLGVAPVRGRTFAPDEDQPGRDGVVVIGEGLWRRRYGADPAALGSTLRLDGKPHTVVGVLPASFRFPPSFGIDGGATSIRPDLWVPLALDEKERLDRSLHTFDAVARLKPGVTLEQARSEIARIDLGLQRTHPGTNEGFTAGVSLLSEQLTRSARPTLLVLLGAVALVLLIGCANVASLLLARTAARQREIALRTALGASRSRLARQLLVESALLAVPGASLGLGLAYAGARALATHASPFVPGVQGAGLDLHVLVFAVTVSLAATLLFGLAPALLASSPDLVTTLKEGGAAVAGGGRKARARKALVVLETALALTLLVGATAAIKGLIRLHQTDAGFRPDGVLTARLNLSESKYPGDASKVSFTRDLRARIAGLPGVLVAGTIDVLPVSGRDYYWSFSVEGRPPARPGELPLANFRTISPGLFAALGIVRHAGRDFTDLDAAAAAPVVIVNETLATRFFPGASALGKRLNFEDPPAEPIWHEIVGVVGDVKFSGLDAKPSPDVYVSQYQAPRPSVTLVVKSDRAAADLAPALRSEVARLDAAQPVFDVKAMSESVAESLARPRLLALLLASFAGVALLLAAVGLYGIVAYSVVQRTREMAIRSALGATRTSIVALVMRQALVLTGVGIALGTAGGLALTRVMSRHFHGVDAWDPPLLAGAAALLALVSAAAALVPALRATRVEPATLLHAE